MCIRDRVWTEPKAGPHRLQQRGLVILDLEQLVTSLLDDMRADGALGEERVTSDQHIGQLELRQQRQRLRELILPLADGELGQDGPAPASEGAEQVGTGQVLVLGATHGLAAVSYTHLRAHETPEHLVCRLL